MRIRVSVTDRDIAEGVKGACECPVALALKRTLGRPVYVGFHDFCFSDDPPGMTRKHYPIQEAKAFIANFDLDGQKSVQPFEFMADLGQYAVIDL
jgi:hypothetical protein